MRAPKATQRATPKATRKPTARPMARNGVLLPVLPVIPVLPVLPVVPTLTVLPVLLLALGLAPAAMAEEPACTPAWEGTPLIECDSLAGWTVERDDGSTGSLQLVEPLVGGVPLAGGGPLGAGGDAAKSIQLTWDLGSGDWVQARYRFSSPVDLRGADLFGITLRGGGAGEIPNTVSVMFADSSDVFYGYDMPGERFGVNQLGRTLWNLPLPKKMLWFFFSFGAPPPIDWSRIDRFFLVVKRPGPGKGGGSGRIGFDRVRHTRAADWPRQKDFERPALPRAAARKAIDYILGQQKATGLFLSWKEEPAGKAWLYDQALALIALSRAGSWIGGEPRGDSPSALAATALADFLVRAQKGDGRWARCWNPASGVELVDDRWVGDQSWCVLALSLFAEVSGSAAAREAARRGAAWLAALLDDDGKVAVSTEGNVDAWWAFVATSRLLEAEAVRDHLLRDGAAWDPDLRYWWRGFRDPVVAIDAATWLSAFARHRLVGERERGLAALGFARRALATLSDDGTLCGLDGMGPVSLWNEGTAQFVAAGGEGSATLAEALLAEQRPDGSMPGSPDDWTSDAFGWLSSWSGIAPTAWLHFAVEGQPFPLSLGLMRGDANADGQVDISDAVRILLFLFAGLALEGDCAESVADANADGAVDSSDAIFLLAWLFREGPAPDRLIWECEP